MEIFNDIEEFVEIVGEVLDSQPFKKDDIYSFSYKLSKKEEMVFSKSESELNEIFNNLSDMEEIDISAITNGNAYEVLVSDESSRSIFNRGFNNGKNLIYDNENKITYKLARPSNEYILFLYHRLSKIMPVSLVFSTYGLNSIIAQTNYLYIIGDSDVINNDLFSALRMVSPRLLTLRIDSEKKTKTDEFKKLTNSFMFQLSYNLNLPIVPQKNFDKLIRTGKISRKPGPKFEDLEAPKRMYIPEITHHYQLGIASQNPSLEYLSYYHVIEYFFEAVFNDDLIQRISNRITNPGFSSKRKKDIKNLIEEISNSLKFRDETTIFSESEAVLLTLKRYVKVDELINKIKMYDDELLEFLKNNIVSFSGGSTVDLLNNNIDQIYRNLSDRIYKTRNSIVHSKESEKSRFIPFEHDKELSKEISLLRFISELVIIESSSMLSLS